MKNFIFDLGGVILNLDYQKTSTAFTCLGVPDFDALYTQSHADPLFQRLECGKATPSEFIAALKLYCPQAKSGDDITAAWNAMLLDFPEERIRMLRKLKLTYRTFLLSNTNAIHFAFFDSLFRKKFGGEPLSSCFEKAYYSYEIGFRKPNKEAFEFVLENNNLEPEETLFIDDTISNIESAQTLGLQTVFLQAPLTLEEVLAPYVKS